MDEQRFSIDIIDWYKTNKRDLPWRNTSDPYEIWLSEIILQQTRVDQGMSYFIAFVENYPTIQTLAQAPEDEVLRLWQGLGYYSRARNLHETAKYIVKECNGEFPNTYDQILKLKGIGTYTAAAIASFSFNEKKAVLDGNVYRVLSRVFGIMDDISINSTKKVFQKVADRVLFLKDPGLHNQAIMEFGALNCVPANPLCSTCPINHSCYAYSHKKQHELPVKTKKVKVRTRNFSYLLLKINGEFLMKKRGGKDIWEGLYDFPLVEMAVTTTNEFELLKEIEFFVSENTIRRINPHTTTYKHILSHQKIFATFTEFELSSKPTISDNYTWVNLEKMAVLPKPVLINNFLQEFYF